MMPVSVQVPSRFGPRHCGQSAAIKGPAPGNIKHANSSSVMQCRLMSITTPVWLWSYLFLRQDPIQVAMTNTAPSIFRELVVEAIAGPRGPPFRRQLVAAARLTGFA